MIWIVVVVVAVVLGALWWYVATYNSFVRLRNLVAESWRGVDVQLRRRHDLVPNLVATVERAADYERDTLLAVTQARRRAESVRAAPTIDVAAVGDAEDALTAAIERLGALAEQYPDIGAVRNYEVLQRELGDTEDRIAAARRLYNANVRALNTRIGSVPASVVASLHRVTPEQYFELGDASVRDVVDVDRLFGDRDDSA
ncbi:LemA family protein [Gordonia sp. VNQ95]|uniref:LemA family protein n=1 Tax=Gordonia sp. VNQ95 TaxID=3156619 RepID=UPI0032B591AF